MGIHIIIAHDSNNGIAKNGTIPWKFSKELKYFKEITIGKGKNVLVMGRKTWDSLPRKPLPGRIHIVLSSNENENTDLVLWKKSIDDAIFWYSTECNNIDDLFIIGGEQIYDFFMKEWIDIIDSLYITKINNDFNCDKFFTFTEDQILNMGYEKKYENIDFENNTEIKYLHYIKTKKTNININW